MTPESPSTADTCAAATPLWLSWSGGKDSALALWRLQHSSSRVTGLLTTLTRAYQRISMHGVRRELLQRQAEALALPQHSMWIEAGADNTAYEASFAAAMTEMHSQGTRHLAFGDLYLAEVRAYRERLLARCNVTGAYPLWGGDTRALLEEFIELGFRAIVVCVDPRQLAAEFVGRLLDRRFLEQLPPGVDPCGENGEFHSFVFDGPNFHTPVAIRSGQIVLREGFWFCDVLPADC